MNQQNGRSNANLTEGDWSLPLERDHWQAVVDAMGLSPQYAKVVELVLADFNNQEIAEAMNLGVGTVKDYLKRIGQRTGTRGRLQLAVYVLKVSHEVLDRN